MDTRSIYETESKYPDVRLAPSSLLNRPPELVGETNERGYVESLMPIFPSAIEFLLAESK